MKTFLTNTFVAVEDHLVAVVTPSVTAFVIPKYIM